MPNLASAHSRPSLATFGADIHVLGRKIAVALMVRAERRALMALNEAALKDMGFNKGQAQCEAGRTFWDLPVDRLRT